jgi:hypothetical protein
MHYRIDRVQTAIFLNTIDLSSKLNIATMINKVAGDCLAVDPVFLPLPQNSPQEIPHIIMKNERTGWNFNIGPARMDLTIDAIKSPKCDSYSDATRKNQQLSQNIWEGLVKDFGARANRIGFVFTSSAEIKKSSEYLRNRYLKTSDSDNAEKILFHYLHIIDDGPFKLNKWTRINADNNPTSGHPNLVLEIDLNTIQENSVEITSSIIKEFFTIVNKINNDIISQHEKE